MAVRWTICLATLVVWCHAISGVLDCLSYSPSTATYTSPSVSFSGSGRSYNLCGTRWQITASNQGGKSATGYVFHTYKPGSSNTAIDANVGDYNYFINMQLMMTRSPDTNSRAYVGVSLNGPNLVYYLPYNNLAIELFGQSTQQSQSLTFPNMDAFAIFPNYFSISPTIVPSHSGNGGTYAMTLQGSAWATLPSWAASSFVFGFSTGNCLSTSIISMESSDGALAAGNQLIMTFVHFQQTGTFNLCMSPDFGQTWLNTTSVITAIAMTPWIITSQFGSSLDYASISYSATFNSTVSVNTTAMAVLTSGPNCQAQYLTSYLPVTLAVGVTAATLNFPVPLVPGAYAICLAWTATSTMVMQASTNINRINVYSAVPDSIEGIFPSVVPVNLAFTLNFVAGVFGAAPVSCGPSCALALTTSTCASRYAPLTITGSGTVSVPSNTYAVPGVYSLCYTVSAWSKTAMIAGVTLTVVSNAQLQITAVTPSVIGCGTSPIFNFAVSGSLPSTAMVLIGVGGCSGVPVPIGNGSMISFGTLSPGGCSTPATYTVCIAADGAVFAAQLPTISVKTTGSLTGVTPQSVPYSPSLGNSFVFTGADFLMPAALLRLSPTGTLCVGAGSATQPYAGGYTTFMGLAVGDYDVCYNVGAGYVAVYVNYVHVFTAAYNSLTWTGGTFTEGRANQYVTITAGPATSSSAMVYLTQSPTCGAGTINPLAPPVAYTGAPMTVTVSQSFGPGAALLCFTLDGSAAASINQNISRITIGAEASQTATSTFLGANGQVASGQAFALNITGPFDAVLNSLTFAPDGLCNSPNAWFIPTALPFTAGLISPVLTIPSVLSGASTMTIYPCLSVNYGPFFSQKNAGQALLVTTATATSITALNPSSFIVNTPVLAQFVGVIGTAATQIALSTDGCATRIVNCTASYAVSVPGAFSLGANCKFQTAQTLSVCYTTGSGWFVQLLVSATVTSDPDAGALSSLSPNVIGVGTTPTMQIFAATSGPGVFVGFTAGVCATCNTTCEATTAITGTSVMLGSAFMSTNPQWSVCYTKNYGFTWSTQVSVGVSMKTIQASTSSIGSLTPNVVGLNNFKTLTFTGIEGSTNTYLGLSADNCATIVPASLKNMGVGNTTLSLTLTSPFVAGVYSLCYSTNNTNRWFAQVPTLTIITATTTSVTAMNTFLVGEKVLVDITFTFAPNALSVDSQLSFALANCTTSIKRNIVAPDATGVVSLTTPFSAGVYVICFSTESSVWVQQGRLNLTSVGALPTQIGLVTPTPIGVNTMPTMTFPGAWVSPWTAVSFVSVNNTCGNLNLMQGVTQLTSSVATPLGQVFAVPVDTAFYVCYTTNVIVAVPNWIQQTSGQIYVLAGTATSITNVQPSPIGANIMATLTLNVANGVTPTSYIGFSSIQGGCNNPGQRQGTTKLTGTSNFVTITMASAISIAGPYFTCYSVDGVSYTAQTSPSSQISVVDAQQNSLSNMVPSTIGDTTINTITLSGMVATPTTRIAFSPATDCMMRYSETTITAPGQSSFTMSGAIPTAGDYVVCYTTSGGATWVAQTQVTMHVVSATTTSLGSVTPNFFGTQLALSLTITGGAVSPFSVVAFAWMGNCGAGPYFSLMSFANALTMSASLTVAGVYDTCYSVRNSSGSFLAQSGCQVTVAAPSPTIVNLLYPTTIGAGVLQAFRWNVSDTRLSPVTAMAFVLQNGDCSVMAQRVAQQSITTLPQWSTFGLPAPISLGGNYMLCLTYNLITWTAQTDPTTILHVVAATTTSVTGIAPMLYQNNGVTSVTLTGAAFTSTSMFAFAVHGLCSITRYAVTDYSNPDVNGGVLMGSAISIGASAQNMSICYSVNGGISWVEQDNLQVLVVTACDNLYTCESCHQSPFCTWCLPAATCSVNVENATQCPAVTNVAPGDSVGCPALTFPQHMSGSLAGRTNVTLMSNGRFFPTDQLQCFWDFTFQTNVTEFVVTSPSSGWCLSPEAPAGVVGAYLSMKYNDQQFTITSTNQRAFWIYYDCEQRLNGLCTSCWNLQKPDCGVCFTTGACQADFECDDLWGGSQCPALSDLEPPQVNYRGEVPVYITGTLFVNSTTMNCYFGTQWANATYINETMVSCIVPAGEASTAVQVTVLDRGLLYSSDTLTLLYTPDPVPAAIIPPPTVVPPDRLTIPLVSTIVGLVVIGLIIAIVVLNRRRKARQALLPPPLTANLKEEIIFGDNMKTSTNAKQIAPNVAPLLELLMIPNSPVLIALTKVIESTEADNISRALVYVTESRGRTVDVMKSLVTSEIDSAEHMSTLFRTNSFVTKMFKVYSKIVGLEYVHTTLGYELNASLAGAKSPEGEEAALDVKDDNNDDVQLNKLIILTVCQRVLLAITKSEKEVPTEFRELFAHIKTCMTNKFRVTSDSLAKLTAGNLTATLVETRVAMSEKTTTTLHELNNLQASLVSGIAGGQMDPQTQHQLSGVSQDVEAISKQLIATLKACKDLEASMYPDSEEAKRIKHEHELAQNSIAVGGFFFLRFIVPAITAPDAYALVRETPDANTIKTLILCGKVLQNLSNDKEMGGKEEYMAKMNEFIISNRKPMRKFQERLMVKRDSDSGSYESVPVPQRLVDAASVQIYEYMISRFKQIMAVLDTPTTTEDAQRGLQRAQMANMLVHVMQTVNGQVGESALRSTRGGEQFESIVASRKSGGSNITAHISMRTVLVDDLDSGAGLNSGSATSGSVTAEPVTPNPVYTDSSMMPPPPIEPPPSLSSMPPTPLLPPPMLLPPPPRGPPSDEKLFD